MSLVRMGSQFGGGGGGGLFATCMIWLQTTTFTNEEMSNFLSLLNVGQNIHD